MAEQFRIKIKDGKKYFYRFTPNQRIQHIILASAVIVLVLTGMPLKFHDTFWAPYLYGLFGGIHLAPLIHKAAGVALLVLFVYHLGYVAYNFYQNQIIPLKRNRELSIGRVLKALITHPIVPNLKDAKDIFNLIKYLLFLTDRRPEGAEFTWKEKFDYWGPFWGIAIIGPSGLIMWQKEFVTRFLPGEVINYALIAHSDEALLAALFLFIWHFYNVHFSTSVFPMETSFLTGYLPEELMVEEHYEYYQQIMQVEGLEHEILPPHGPPKPGSKKKPERKRKLSEVN
jgi:cytochrome b subunit of formate dehydrogenase